MYPYPYNGKSAPRTSFMGHIYPVSWVSKNACGSASARAGVHSPHYSVLYLLAVPLLNPFQVWFPVTRTQRSVLRILYFQL